MRYTRSTLPPKTRKPATDKSAEGAGYEEGANVRHGPDDTNESGRAQECGLRRRCHLASGSGRSWNFMTLLVVPLPPSM